MFLIYFRLRLSRSMSGSFFASAKVLVNPGYSEYCMSWNTNDIKLALQPANASKYGTGGPDYTVPAEFVPEYTHKKGALAAARRGDAANPAKASSGSQFYLVQDEANCAQLDGAYTVFGETLEGIATIDKIASVETNSRDCPVSPVKIVSVTLSE